MFSNCKYILGAAFQEQIPSTVLPEIAFVGRSNVGKSSLVNAVFKEGIAKVSKTPGRTQLINFFNVDDKLIMVDLPGYGYAEVSKTIKKDWNRLILQYIQGRQQLRRVFLLIDSRHGLKQNDFGIIDILDKAAVVYQIVLTKIDKVSDAQYLKLQKEIETRISKKPAAFPSVICSSSEKKIGIDAVREAISGIVV